MNRGTIVLAKFPFTDLTSAKRRPAIVLSSKISTVNDVIVAFISSVIPVELSETDLLIDRQHQDYLISGLKSPSVIKLDKLATLNTSVLSGEIGRVSATTLSDINKKLVIALSID